jgi:hypothetical protein
VKSHLRETFKLNWMPIQDWASVAIEVKGIFLLVLSLTGF